MGSFLEGSRTLTASDDYPELCVEWLPNRGPFEPDGEWCDISDYVAGGSISRGRQYELQQFQAGSCSITLRSADRLFDPDNTAGPFAQALVPMRPVRVSAVWNGTRYALFTGYITDWGQSTINGADQMIETTITARDAMALFEKIDMSSSGFAMLLGKSAPTAWFRLNETGTLRVSDSSGNGNYGLYDNATQGAQGLVAGDSDGAASFAHLGGARVRIQNRNLITNYPFTVSAMIKVDATDPDGFKAIFSGWLPNYFLFGVKVVDAYGPSTLRAFISVGGTTHSEVTGQALDDNVAHHVAWTATAGNTWKLYVDGVEQTTTIVDAGTPGWLTDQPAYWAIGNYADIPDYDLGFGSNNEGTIDEFAVWNGTALDATTIANLARASKGWDGDDTGTRVGRILDLVNWPAWARSIMTGVSVLGPSSWSDGASVLSILQAIADTEFATFYVDRDGVVTFRSRHYAYQNAKSTTSQATFGDSHSSEALKYVANNFELIRDEALIRNPVYASRENGITATAKDVTYVQKYGARSWSAPRSQERNDAAMQDRANWLVSRYKELNTRLGGVQLAPRTNANLWPKALGLGIGDRITVKRTPLGTNSEISTEQIIEGISHVFAPRQWSTTLRGSPVDKNVNTYLVLDDATYGLLGSFALAY